MAITVTITAPNPYTGIVPDKTTQTEDEFANAVHPYLNWQNFNFTPELQQTVQDLNDFKTQANTLKEEVNSDKTATLNYMNTTEGYRDETLGYRNEVMGYVIPTEATYTYQEIDDKFATKVSLQTEIDNINEIDYISTTDPAYNTNPSKLGATWVNTTSGEIFVCKDKTTDKNKWQGQLGSYIRPPIIFDIFGDGSAVSLYEFEGNTEDTGGTYNGTDTLITGYVTGKFGNAVEFDGSTNQHIDFTPINISSRTYTISSWVYRDSSGSGTAAGVGIVQQNSGNHTNILDIVPANGDVYIGNYNVVAGAVPASQWCYVVAVYRVDGCDLYVDNVKLMDNAPVANNYDDLYSIGNRRQANSDYIWKGLIDQVRIFNRALTAQEVQTLYEE